MFFKERTVNGATLQYLFMKNYPFTALALAAAILSLASCSLQLDSQYGLRLKPQPVRSSGIPSNNTFEAAVDAVSEARYEHVLSSEAPNTQEVQIDSPYEFEVLPTQTASVQGGLEELHSTIAQSEFESRADEPANTSKKRHSIPFWVEGLLGVLLALVAIALLAGSFLALLWGVLSFYFGDIAMGWILIGGALVAFILGWILFFYAQPMLPELPPFLFRIPFI
jgi:hypothetical protein